MSNDFEITIPDKTVLPTIKDLAPTCITKIYLEGEIDIVDGDYFSHFANHQNLTEFVVLNNKSSFFTRQGCLYKRFTPNEYNDGTFYLEHIYGICGEIPQDYNGGCILISCPQANPIKDIVLPDDCISIAGGAFYGCNLNSITFPDSLLSTAIAAFVDLKVNTIYVPNKIGNFEPWHNNVENIEIISNDPLAPGLNRETELYWRCVLNENLWEGNRDFIHCLFPDDETDYKKEPY